MFCLEELTDCPYYYASPELYDLDTVHEDISYTANVYMTIILLSKDMFTSVPNC